MAQSKRNSGLVLAARGVAVNRLIAAHAAEFEEYMVEACEERGVTYRPQPSEEDVARKKIDGLLAKHPSLRSEYGPLGVNEKYAPSGLDEFAAAG